MSMESGRILIDCSGIIPATHVTGIPRTVLSYLRELARMAEEDASLRIPVAVHFDRQNQLVRSALWPAHETDAMFWRYRLPLQLARPILYPVAPIARAADLGLRVFDAPGKRKFTWPLRSPASGRKLLAEGLGKRALNHIPVKPRSGDLILLPAHWYDVSPAIYFSLQNDGARIVLFIHDILPVTTPHYYDSPWRDRFAARLARMLRHADALVTVSAFTMAEVERFAGERQLVLPEHRLVVHHGSDFVAPTDDERPPTVRPYFLMVGSVEPKKNHRFAIEQCDYFWQRGYEFDLVIVGKPGWKHDRISEFIRSHADFGDRLQWKENVSDEHLDALYRSAAATLFVTRAEGFGLPLIESTIRGTRCIASNIPVLREIADGSDLVVHVELDDDGDSLRQAILDALAFPPPDDAEPPAIARRSWSEAAAELSRFLEAIPSA